MPNFYERVRNRENKLKFHYGSNPSRHTQYDRSSARLLLRQRNGFRVTISQTSEDSRGVCRRILVQRSLPVYGIFAWKVSVISGKLEKCVKNHTDPSFAANTANKMNDISAVITPWKRAISCLQLDNTAGEYSADYKNATSRVG